MKKVGKILLLIGFIIIIIAEICTIYKSIVCGNQPIIINTSEQARANSDLYVSIRVPIGVDFQTNIKLKLVDAYGKKVKNAQVIYNGNSAIISIPQVEAGNYFIEANVSSDVGADKIKKPIYISDKCNINLHETTMRNTEEKIKACGISVVLYLIIFVIIEGYLCIKIPEFGKMVKHIANIIVITMTVVITTVVIIEEYFWRYNYSWWMFAITAIICLANYLSWICKLNKKIYKTSISIMISYILVVGIMVGDIAFNISVDLFIIIIIIIALLMLILAIISRINETHKLKYANLIEKISKGMIYIYKFAAVEIISILAGFLIICIINSAVAIIIPISVLGIYFINYLCNKTDTNKKKKGVSIVNALAGIGVLAILGFILYCIAMALIVKMDSGIFDQSSSLMSDLDMPTLDSNYSASAGIES